MNASTRYGNDPTALSCDATVSRDITKARIIYELDEHARISVACEKRTIHLPMGKYDKGLFQVRENLLENEIQ